MKKQTQTFENSDKGKSLCLHSCCAPCSSYCLLYLSSLYRITVYFHNPNITSSEEYIKRAEELKRLIDIYNSFSVNDHLPWDRGVTDRERKHPELYQWIRDRFSEERFKIEYAEGDHDPQSFYRMAEGLENEPERGVRCHGCYRLRLEDTAGFAIEKGGFDFFATTLTLSPLKDAAVINAIGKDIEKNTHMTYLETDFKKNNGYLISIILSEMFGLYRQNYCGCEYSKKS